MTDVIIARTELEALQAKLDAAENDAAARAAEVGRLQASITAVLEIPQNKVSAALERRAEAAGMLQADIDILGADISAAGDMVAGWLAPTPPPDDDLIGEWADVTAPIKLGDAGALVAARALAMVVKPGAGGGYRKALGAASTQNQSASSGGGFAIGLMPDGTVEAWVGSGSGGQIAQVTTAGKGTIPPNKARFIGFLIGDAALDLLAGSLDKAIGANIPTPKIRNAADGATYIGAGCWGSKEQVDPLGGILVRFRAWRSPNAKAVTDSWAEWTAAGLIDDDDPVTPPGPPANGGLEPVDGSAKQVAVAVERTERQTIEGFGAGFGPITELNQVFPRMQQYAKTDFDDIRLKLARIIWSGDGATLGKAYAPVLKWAAERVASYGETLHVHATCFQYTNGDPIGSANRLAASIAAGVNQGCQIDSVCMANEPGGTSAHWPPGDHVPAHRQMRAQLDASGLQRIILTGLEYPKDSLDPTNDNCRFHFDQLNASGLIPSAVPIGAVHCYGDCTTVELADKWGKLGIMQLEAGFGSNPSVGCRMVNDLNKNVRWWSYHLLQAFNADAPGDYGQKLVNMSGVPNAYYRAYQALSTKFLPGTVMRRCTLNGSIPFITQSGRSPFFAACGKRWDSQWVYAAQNGESVKQQFTFTVPELAGYKRGYIGVRVNSSGSATMPVGLTGDTDGHLRMTAGPGELIVVVG